MNFKKTLILAGILLLAVVYLTRVSEPLRQAELAKSNIFAALDATAIKKLQVSLGGSEPFTLVKTAVDSGTGSSWGLEDLPGGKLDDAGVLGILTSLKSLSFDGPIPDRELGADFSVYGLDKPALSLTIELLNGNQQEVAFGKKSEYLMKRYAKASGHAGLFLIDESSFQQIKKDRNQLRSKNPIVFNDVDVRELVLDSRAGRVVITQPAVGEWRITEPIATGASKDSVEQLLLGVRDLRAEDFIDSSQPKLSRFGLDKPRVSVSLTLREGINPHRYTIKLGEGADGQDTGTYFTYDGAPTIFKTGAEKVAPLERKVLDLREKKLLSTLLGSIEKITSVGVADTPVTIQTDGSTWSVNGKRGDQIFVEQLIKDITGLEAVDFPKAIPPDAFSEQFLTLSLTKKGGAETTVLRVGKQKTGGSDDKVRYVKVNDNGEVALVRDIEAKRIVPHEGALVQQPTPQPPSGSAEQAK